MSALCSGDISVERREQEFHHISADTLDVIVASRPPGSGSFCCSDKSQQVAECFTSEGVATII